MKARNPRIDFADALPHWSPNREFAQATNGGSMTLPYLEPYLNRVMLTASKLLGAHPAIQADIALFVAQEGHHYRQHKLFNRRLGERYPALAPLEREMREDYDRFLRERSLKFNCAYCEGFESQGVIYGQFFFEAIDDLLVGADSKVVTLWKWHLAEEFEHKAVCHDVYRTLFGGYFMRIYAFFFTMRHLGGFARRAAAIMLEQDREGMSAAERKASRKRERAFTLRQARYSIPQFLKVLSPFYDPRRRKEPRGTRELLREVDAVAIAA